MASPISYPLINGVRYSWASIELQANGLPLVGIKSINYKDSLKPGMPRGTSPVALGFTRGQYEASGDMEVYRLEFEALTDSLGIGFGETPVTISVQYYEPIVGVVQDTIQLRITDVDTSNSDSTDASSIKLSFAIIVPIDWNGTTLVAPGP